jgi:hypothetical protein
MTMRIFHGFYDRLPYIAKTPRRPLPLRQRSTATRPPPSLHLPLWVHPNDLVVVFLAARSVDLVELLFIAAD